MIDSKIKIGVLGIQGAFAKHISMLKNIGVQAEAVKYPEQIDQFDGLIIPGGESTTMSKFFDEIKIRSKLINFDKPIFGTCAGAILLSRNTADPLVNSLNLVPIDANRNAYGRQTESFISDINLEFDSKPFRAIFIRAPKLSNPAPEVQIMGTFNDDIVLVRYRNVLLSTFHPELTDDSRIHRYFLEYLVAESYA